MVKLQQVFAETEAKLKQEIELRLFVTQEKEALQGRLEGTVRQLTDSINQLRHEGEVAAENFSNLSQERDELVSRCSTLSTSLDTTEKNLDFKDRELSSLQGDFDVLSR